MHDVQKSFYTSKYLLLATFRMILLSTYSPDKSYHSKRKKKVESFNTDTV